ncbi:pentapeptide repeat-containing protein [Tundrisphaera lichenicola]|uniref:pentapeptide repeat-containing protein n=1 Tax=Tundrisphaera lichenicola TaxID=2029860 RepID=UPI003EB6FB92
MATDGQEMIQEAVEPGLDIEDEAPKIQSKVSSLGPAEALERLRRGELISDARIDGLRFKGEFSLPVRMERVELVNPKFGGARFLDEVSLVGCKLVRPSCGHGASFDRGFDLRGSTIIRGHFARITVKGAWRCDNLKAIGHFVVIQSRFEDKVRFWEARFEGWAEFKDCTFVGEADLRSFHAEEGFILAGCKFEGDALFRGATVCKKWDAGVSRFERLLDLSKVKFHDFVYLETIEAGPDHRIAFHNALIERVLIRSNQVEGRLLSEETGQHEQAMHEYGLLKRVFEGLHRYEQEDWAFYRFKVNQRRSRPRSWKRPFSKFSQLMDWLFLDLGCGYGTNPFRAVRMSGLLMLAFGLIYMVDVSALPVEKRPFDQLAVTHPMNRIMIGLLTSVSVFTSGFGSLRDAAQGWMNVPLIVESLLGTLLWGLFIVAFSRKVIR